MVNAILQVVEQLKRIADHLEGIRREGIVVWGGQEPEEN